MSTLIKIKREDASKRFWVIVVKDGKPDHLRSFLFGTLHGEEDAAYALAEVFAEGIAQGFRTASELLPKDVEYLTR